MRAIVTAPALVLLPGPGSPVLKLTPEEAAKRKLCMTPIGDGFFKVISENHYKKGTVVEFQGDVPKAYAESVVRIDANGNEIGAKSATPVQPVRAVSPAADPQAGKAPQKAAAPDFDSMTKAQMLDFAEEHHIPVDQGMSKATLIHVLKKKTPAA